MCILVLGIYLCRCADVITRKPSIYQYNKENVMLVCRIMKVRGNRFFLLQPNWSCKAFFGSLKSIILKQYFIHQGWNLCSLFVPHGSASSVGKHVKKPLHVHSQSSLKSEKLSLQFLQGKPKTLQGSQGEELEPTCEFDSHMSVKFQRGRKMAYEVVYDVSQVSWKFYNSCEVTPNQL